VREIWHGAPAYPGLHEPDSSRPPARGRGPHHPVPLQTPARAPWNSLTWVASTSICSASPKSARRRGAARNRRGPCCLVGQSGAAWALPAHGGMRALQCPNRRAQHTHTHAPRAPMNPDDLPATLATAPRPLLPSPLSKTLLAWEARVRSKGARGRPARCRGLAPECAGAGGNGEGSCRVGQALNDRPPQPSSSQARALRSLWSTWQADAGEGGDEAVAGRKGAWAALMRARTAPQPRPAADLGTCCR
jgi:hypothetical protein